MWCLHAAVYNGNYQITFYAEDSDGNIASSTPDTVLTVNGGIDPPAHAQVQIAIDKDRYQRGDYFQATLTEDLGWGYDLCLFQEFALICPPYASCPPTPTLTP